MLHPFFFLSFLQISVGYVTVKVGLHASCYRVENRRLIQLTFLQVLNKHLVGKSVKPLWGTEEPNMIGEQILELRDGLSTFQETTFEYLYDKKVGWTKGAKSSVSKSSIDDKTKVGQNVEIVAPVIVETEAAEVIIEEPIDVKIVPSVMVKPIVAKSPEVNKDVIAVRDIPIRPKPEIDEELDAELKKKAIMKAQQAVTQSFLSLKNELPIQADGGDIFSDDLLQKTADGSSSAKVTPKSSRSEPTSLPAVKESAKSDITLKSVPKAMSSSEAPPGGFFGFLKQSTVFDEIPIVSSAKIVANRVTPPMPPALKEATSKVDEKKSTNDMFGTMSKDLNNVMTGIKGTSSIRTVPVNSVSDIKAAPKQDVAKATKDSPTVPSPGGGLFGILKASPSATITKAKVTRPVVPPSPQTLVQQVVADSTAAPKGGFFGLLNSPLTARNAPVVTKIAPTVETKEKARVSVKASAPVTQAAAPTAAQDSGKGLFSFFNKKEEISAIAVTAKIAESSKSVAAAVGMNAKFQSTVLKLLKGDNGKVKAFQRATDDFRSGDVSGEAFIQTLETLFGSDALELVVTPLVSELPERTMAVKLKVAYDKNVAAVKASSSPKASFSFSFPGQGPKKVTSPSPAVLVLPVVEKKPISSKLKSLTPAPAAPVRTAVFRVPSKVPIGKKVSIERQMKSLLAGSIDATTFYTSISKELGKEKMIEVISDIIIAFPADIRTKLDALNRSNK
jgi:hypothetical protein